MSALEDEVDRVAAEKDFAGVVRVDRGANVEIEKAYGLAHRGERIENAVATRFAIASATKGLTALTVMSLVEVGNLGLSTTARSVLGDDLPLIAPEVTVEHLLEHRSGIGDYIDEDAGWDVNDYVLNVPAHRLVTTEDYLPALDGFPAKFGAGERFSYCNSGYVVLALIAERCGGAPFHDLVHRRVCGPAGMAATEFLRSDELPGGVALGYLRMDGVSRTNVFHLPVRGSGDGGIYTTAADIRSLWTALFAGRIVSQPSVADLTRPRSLVASQSRRYGRGFWLHPSRDIAILEGLDAGVSFRSVHDPAIDLTHTVISNTSDGAWPITHLVDNLVSHWPLP